MATQADLDRLTALRDARDKLAIGRSAVSVTLPGGQAITYNRVSLRELDREILDLEIKCGERRRGALRMLG